MNQAFEPRGAEVAKGIRGCTMAFFVPVVAVCIGILVGQRYASTPLGILAGLGAVVIVGSLAKLLISRTTKGLSLMDCFMPTIMSLCSGILFAPIALFSGSLFSSATCIVAGVLFSITLVLYRSGKIGAGYLILPGLTFVYEMLPIELPTDLDNLLGLGVSSVNTVLAFGARNAQNQLAPASEEEEQTLLPTEEEAQLSLPAVSEVPQGRMAKSVRKGVAAMRQGADIVEQGAELVGRAKAVTSAAKQVKKTLKCGDVAGVLRQGIEVARQGTDVLGESMNLAQRGKAALDNLKDA